jgi:hypothetical protein
MPNEEAARLAEDWNEDLEKMEVGFSLMFIFFTFDTEHCRRPECSPLQQGCGKGKVKKKLTFFIKNCNLPIPRPP